MSVIVESVIVPTLEIIRFSTNLELSNQIIILYNQLYQYNPVL
jgi:hypothetical protein